MRLTKKIKVITGVDNKGIEDAREVIAISDKKLAEEKLFALEDIEEKLGIDLITLFKALNGCWFLQISTKKIFGDIRPTLIYQGGWHLKPNLTELPILYAFEDYGKTWALTKEELL